MVAAFDTAGAISREIVGHKKKVHSVAWNRAGRKLASGSVDQSARVWDVEHGVQSGKEIELKGHSDSVDQLTWDPSQSDVLASVSADKTLRIWDARAAGGSRCVAKVDTSGENINVAWSPDGGTIAVGDRDDVVSFVDARKHKIIKTTKFPFEVNEIDWDNAGARVYLTTGLGTVEVLEFPSMTAAHTIHAHTAGCYCIAFDPTGAHFAVGERGRARVHLGREGERVRADGAAVGVAGADAVVFSGRGRTSRARRRICSSTSRTSRRGSARIRSRRGRRRTRSRGRRRSCCWRTRGTTRRARGAGREGTIRIWGKPGARSD